MKMAKDEWIMSEMIGINEKTIITMIKNEW